MLKAFNRHIEELISLPLEERPITNMNKKLYNYMMMKKYLMICCTAVLLTSCGVKKDLFVGTPSESSNPRLSKEGIPEGRQPKIDVIFNVHLDPVGIKGSEQERLERYQKHRDALHWLKNAADQEGFKISAQMTGVYAEFAVRMNHEEDFRQFMPGHRHALGTHLHTQYKQAEDQDRPFHWSFVPPPATELAQQIFTDNLIYINQIFTKLGYSVTDNHMLHGTQAHGVNMGALYGATENDNVYPNRFDVIEGKRGYYHPYRSNPNSDLLIAKEELDQPFIAVPSASYVFGKNAMHGPEGMTYGMLPYIQRDFILEYLEWRYFKKHNLKAKPWVFGFDIHPYQILTDSLDVRRDLRQFYQWMNKKFIGHTASYATMLESAERYLKWEKANPQTKIYKDIDRGKNGVQVELKTWRIHDAVRKNQLYYVAMRKKKNTELYEFANEKGRKALLVIPDGKIDFDLKDFFTGQVDVFTVDSEESALELNDVIMSDKPVFILSHS